MHKKGDRLLGLRLVELAGRGNELLRTCTDPSSHLEDQYFTDNGRLLIQQWGQMTLNAMGQAYGKSSEYYADFRKQLDQFPFVCNTRAAVGIIAGAAEDYDRGWIEETEESMPFPRNDVVSLVKQDGQVFSNIPASVQAKLIFIDDATIPIEEDDFLERVLPNGLTERYVVLDRGFYNTSRHRSAHYQIKVSKEAVGAGGVTTGAIQITGHNARVNINSQDNSLNTFHAQTSSLFKELQEAIEAGVTNDADRNAIIKSLAELEASHGTPSFLQKYQAFIQQSANHMTIIAPFIPMLTLMLTGHHTP